MQHDDQRVDLLLAGRVRQLLIAQLGYSVRREPIDATAAWRPLATGIFISGIASIFGKTSFHRRYVSSLMMPQHVYILE